MKKNNLEIYKKFKNQLEALEFAKKLSEEAPGITTMRCLEIHIKSIQNRIKELEGEAEND